MPVCDRSAQGNRADLEEGILRGRRGVDRMPDVASAGASFVGDARALRSKRSAEKSFRLAPPTVAYLRTRARPCRLVTPFCARESRRTFPRERPPAPSLRGSEQPKKDPPCTSVGRKIILSVQEPTMSFYACLA